MRVVRDSIAEFGDRAARARLGRYALCRDVEVRRGEGWLAVATGARSNDMNGVISDSSAALEGDLVDDLVTWFQQRALPASWLTTEARPRLTAALIDRSATPERTGWWIGRGIEDEPEAPTPPDDVEIRRVRNDGDLDDWLDVAAACEWTDGDDDRAARRRLYHNVGFDATDLRHWIARFDGTPVAMASSFLDGDVVELCNLAVVGPMRRHGIGRAIVIQRLVDAAQHGATAAVSAVSHDGARLYRTLAFDSAPVTPDTCFYLPLSER